MAITFRQLEVFVAAASDCNFRRTADRLEIEQQGNDKRGVHATRLMVTANMVLERRGISLLFDHFAASGLADGRIVKFGPNLPSMSLVLLIGSRAQRPAALPAPDLFRQSTRKLASRQSC